MPETQPQQLVLEEEDGPLPAELALLELLGTNEVPKPCGCVDEHGGLILHLPKLGEAEGPGNTRVPAAVWEHVNGNEPHWHREVPLRLLTQASISSDGIEVDAGVTVDF